MPRPPSTIRTRFFYRHLVVGGVAVLVLAVILGGTDYARIRHMLEMETVHKARMLALRGMQKPWSFDELQYFSHDTSLTRVCFYDPEGRLAAHWAREGDCPPTPSQFGVTMDRFTMRLAQKIMNEDAYGGLIYLESVLPMLQDWLAYLALKAGLLTLVVIAAAWVSASISARTIGRSILALEGQIACLKQHDIAFCPLPMTHAAREIAQLAECVASLKSHIRQTMVERGALHQLHGWHWELVEHMVAALRTEIGDGASVASTLDHYALWLQLEAGRLLPPPATSFMLAPVLDRALMKARHLHPPGGHIHVSAALEAPMPKLWLGQPDLLEALLQHLLLIGLKRTRKGYVTLRLQVDAEMGQLRILYEDTGATVQPWQLQEWLAPRSSEAAGSAPTDISWLLVARLVERLEGVIEGYREEGSIRIEAMLPLATTPEVIPENTSFPLVAKNAGRPLILAAEANEGRRPLLAASLFQAGFEPVLVETNVQLVELAPVLPCAVLLLDAPVKQRGKTLVQRLRHLMDHGVMPNMPLWAMRDYGSWLDMAGVEELLKPLDPNRLRALRQPLVGPDVTFYRQCDEQVRQDLPEGIAAQLPMMDSMLQEQVHALVAVVASFADGVLLPVMVEQAHAVKSAALTLGYFRLAGLMEQIEHASEAGHFSAFAENWRVLAALLRSIRFA